nr:putative mitochondrial protein [Tanacetum cinerariifolium]
MRRNDKGTSRETQPQFTRMTKIEFPKFGRDDVRGWLYKCEQFFKINHVLDPHKLQLALIHLYDTANLWHRQFVKLMGESASWNYFKEAIMQRFGSPYDDPMGDIKNLRHTGSIEEYQNAFDRLLSRIDLPKDQQVSCYIAGLQNDVEMAVTMFRPKTLAEVYHLSKVQEAAIKVNKQKYRPPLLPTPRGQVFNLEVIADPVHDYSNDSVIDHDEEVVHEEVTGEVIKLTPQISLNALNGVESFQTLRVTGHVGKQDLHVLIDIGSTHNFLDVNKAKQLGCHFSHTCPLKVDIPSGAQLTIKNMCKKFAWKIRGEEFFVDAMLLHLGESIPTPIVSLLAHFHDVFAIPTSLPHMREYDHKIVLKKGTEPILADFIDILMLRRMILRSWKLNAQIIKDKFLILIIEELIDKLQGLHYFSKLDLRSGYLQIRMCQDDVEKTAFKTHEGHYEFLVMPFGLTNAPSTFQALMNSVFKKYLRKFVLVFFDDILVYSPDFSTHVKHLELVLQLLRRHTLFAKQSKCVFGSTIVEYLGHVITGAGVATDDTKIEAMKHWPIPSNLKQLRGFLGLTGYYRRFIKGYALISQPLTKLLKKNAFVWTKEAQSAFVHLKEAMVNALVLNFPDFNKPFIVETDASGEGIGVVLQQSGHHIAYYSKTLAPRHHSLSTYEKELLAVIQALHKITTPAQMKWLPKLIGFDNELVYKKGIKNKVADALTRVDTGKLVVGDDPALRLSLLTYFYGDSTGGHFGIVATTQRYQAFCYWRKIKKQVKEFVSKCDVCQRSKLGLSTYHVLLQPLPIPTLLWSEISMDFVEGLSNSSGKTVIMVVVDRLSKYSHFMELSHPFTTIQVAQLFLDNVYKLHGLLKIIVNERDKIFLSLFWKELFKMLQEKPKEWAKWLSLAEYWYNTNFHTSINTTPFETVYGQPPTSPILYSPGKSKVDSVDRSLAAREAIRQMLQFHLERALSRMKAITDLHRTDRKMVKENNKLLVYVWIQWSNGSPDDATWELATALEKKFPDFPFNS